MGEVKVGYGDSAQDTAILLLAAAEETETEKYLVRHIDGAFYVPEEVAKEAGVDYEADDGENEPVRSEHHPDDIGQSVDQDAAEKKPAAKKAAAKKAATAKSGN